MTVRGKISGSPELVAELEKKLAAEGIGESALNPAITKRSQAENTAILVGRSVEEIQQSERSAAKARETFKPDVDFLGEWGITGQ